MLDEGPETPQQGDCTRMWEFFQVTNSRDWTEAGPLFM